MPTTSVPRIAEAIAGEITGATTRGNAHAWRRRLGIGIVLLGVAVVIVQSAQALAGTDPRMKGALLGGLFAALATALGTVPVLLSQQFSQRTYDSMLGFGAGVMLAASSFSLVIPALAAAKAQGAGGWGVGRHRRHRHPDGCSFPARHRPARAARAFRQGA